MFSIWNDKKTTTKLREMCMPCIKYGFIQQNVTNFKLSVDWNSYLCNKKRSRFKLIFVYHRHISLKLLLSGLTYAQNVPDKLWGEYLMKCLKIVRPIIYFFGIFCWDSIKTCEVGQTFSSFDLFPSFTSVATNAR